MATKRTKEKGSALIFALVMILVLSVMGSSLMFLSQSETWSSMNYRMMSQARYGAESGLSVAADYFVNTYASPTANRLCFPQCLANPIIRWGPPSLPSGMR